MRVTWRVIDVLVRLHVSHRSDSPRFVSQNQTRLTHSGFAFFFFQAEDGIRDLIVTGVQTCALPISQFCPVFTEALIAKRAEPLRRMSLQDCGTGADDFSALAPGVERLHRWGASDAEIGRAHV